MDDVGRPKKIYKQLLKMYRLPATMVSSADHIPEQRFRMHALLCGQTMPVSLDGMQRFAEFVRFAFDGDD
jgi:hypothetical protein